MERFIPIYFTLRSQFGMCLHFFCHFLVIWFFVVMHSAACHGGGGWIEILGATVKGRPCFWGTASGAWWMFWGLYSNTQDDLFIRKSCPSRVTKRQASHVSRFVRRVEATNERGRNTFDLTYLKKHQLPFPPEDNACSHKPAVSMRWSCHRTRLDLSRRHQLGPAGTNLDSGRRIHSATDALARMKLAGG